MIWLIFLLMSLTAYRVTRLIVRDTFPPVLWLRDRLAGGYRQPTRAEMYHPAYPVGELEPHTSRAIPGLRGLWSLDEDGQIQVWRSHWTYSPHWLAELITCPWCASAYVAGALTAAVDVFYGIPVPWLIGPAVWAVAAVLASREEL